MDDIELSVEGDHGTTTVSIDPALGGRIVQIDVTGQPLLIDAPAPADRDPSSVAWGSYPMAPWAGRVRDGEFTFFETDYHLHLNQDDSGVGAAGRQHAMHGTVLGAVWQVDDHSEQALSITCPLDQPDSGWTLGGVARQRLTLSDGQLVCELSVSIDPDAPDDAQPSAVLPAEIGWHPWWRKPDAVTFDPDAMYQRDSVGLPTGQLVAPSAGPWDDCFVNTTPVTLHYDRPLAPTITLTSDCDHWVVYDMPDHATCVEAQSGPPDAFNLRPQIVTAARPLRRTMTVSW